MPSERPAVDDDWILVRDIAEDLGISPVDHVERWSIWTAVGFRPTRIPVRSKTGVVKRWAVTVEQAQRLLELHASAVVFN